MSDLHSSISDIALFDSLPREVRAAYRQCDYGIPVRYLLDYASIRQLPLLPAFMQIEAAVRQWSEREWPRGT